MRLGAGLFTLVRARADAMVAAAACLALDRLTAPRRDSAPAWIPPYGANQREYADVLGTHRLYLDDGYALHGTTHPTSIGQAVRHGGSRLRNEDRAVRYDRVAIGTPGCFSC